ncbi:TPA: hypothetical protein ACH3X1_014758 [Trebouxia sp. C0004]
MAQLSQQMHGLAQFLAAGFGSGRAKAGQLSPCAVPSVQQPVYTPQRKKLRKADDARHVAVLGQRQTAAAVLTGPIANGVQTVYPEKAGEELWVTWRGRYATLGRYPSWQLLLEEWKEGIPYLSTTIGTRKQTVPMAQLEQDWAEGVQRKNSPSFP